MYSNLEYVLLRSARKVKTGTAGRGAGVAGLGLCSLSSFPRAGEGGYSLGAAVLLLPLTLALGFGVLRRPTSCILAVVSPRGEGTDRVAFSMFCRCWLIQQAVHKHRQQAGSYRSCGGAVEGRCCFCPSP